MTVVWGIDVSTTRVAFAATNGATASVEISKKLEGSPRLHIARYKVAEFASGFARLYPPLCVWVEQPTGRHPKPTLIHMVGVVQEAIYGALLDEFRYPVTVYPIAVPSWKKATLGHGNASKEDVYEWAAGKQSVLIFTEGDAAVQGLANQDEADALAIAFAGRSMISVAAA